MARGSTEFPRAPREVRSRTRHFVCPMEGREVGRESVEPLAPILRIKNNRSTRKNCMESRIQAVLERLEARSQQENSLLESLRSRGGSAIRDRAENLMLDVGPEVGLFLNLLVRSTRATAVIEIGGSVGYSTIWLAEAVRANGGRLYSFEVNSAKQQEQKENLEAAGLLSVVELIDQEASITGRNCTFGISRSVGRSLKRGVVSSPIIFYDPRKTRRSSRRISIEFALVPMRVVPYSRSETE